VNNNSVMLPTPDGHWRPFRPSRPVSPEVRAAIQRAARLAWERRDRTPKRTMQAGRQAIERARQDAITRGIAIDHEREAVLDGGCPPSDMPTTGEPVNAEEPARPGPLRAVLDTNVPIAAHLSRNPHSPTIELVDRWRTGEFTQLYSNDTLAELQEMFMARQIIPEVADQYVADLLRLGEYVTVTPEEVMPVIAVIQVLDR